jgi:hypothetical protein
MEKVSCPYCNAKIEKGLNECPRCHEKLLKNVLGEYISPTFNANGKEHFEHAARTKIENINEDNMLNVEKAVSNNTPNVGEAISAISGLIVLGFIGYSLYSAFLAPNYSTPIYYAKEYISDLGVSLNADDINCSGLSKSGSKYIIKCDIYEDTLNALYGDVIYYGYVEGLNSQYQYYADTSLDKVKSVLAND